MRKLAIAGVILLILGVLVTLALLNLGRLVNRNKDYLLAQAEQTLGRKVEVDDIGVTLWGGIGVRLKNFALADDRTFSQEHAIRAADLQINVALLPLLWKEVRVKRLILREPVITVIRNEKGKLNFASLGRPSRPEGQPTPQPTPSEAPTGLPLLVSLVDVADGQVRYLDRKDRVDLRISQLDLTVEERGADRPLSIDLAAALNADRQNIKISGEIGPVPSTLAWSKVNAIPMRGDVAIESVTLADLNRLAPLAGILPKDLRVDGPLSLTSQVNGTLDELSVAGRVEATASALRLGDHFHKPKGVPFLVTTDARMTQSQITLQKAHITLHTLKLNGTGVITRGETPALRLALDSIRGDLAGWEKILPSLQGHTLSGTLEGNARIQGKIQKGWAPDINGEVTLTAVRATLPQLPQPVTAQRATVTFTGQRATLKETALKLGKSEIRLAAQVEQLTPLSLTYQLSAPEIWVADLRQGTGPTQHPEVLRETTSDGRLSIAANALRYGGRLSSARGRVADIDYTNLQANVAMADRVVTIEDLRLQAYGGSLQGKGRYDLRMVPPQLSLTSEVRKMDLNALLRSASPATAKSLRGGVNCDLSIAGSGNQWEDFKGSLTGKGQTEVLDGALLSVNIAEGALTGLTGVPGLSLFVSPQVRSKYPAIFGTRDTVFSQMKATLAIREGKIHLDDLLIAADDWGVRGKGWTTFDRTLDVRAHLVLSQQLSTDLMRSVKELKYLADQAGRVVIPFALAGTLPSVKPAPDLAYVAGRLVSGTLFKQPAPPPRETPQTEQKSPTPQPPAQPTEPKETSPEEQFRKTLERIFRR